EPKAVAEDFSNYSDIELVRFIASAPNHTRAWEQAFVEFDKRFNRFIGTAAYRKCNQLNYRQGHSYLEDFVQDVYKKLLQNDCEGLKRFNGDHTNQLLRYLQTTTHRVILNKYYRDEIAPTYSPAGGLQSLDQIFNNISDDNDVDMKTLLPDPSSLEDFQERELLEEIEYCLETTQKNNKQKERNILVFKFFVFAGLGADEIADRTDVDISSKRISNLLTDMKKVMKHCLLKRL
ncbi:MAG: sigma-70 family RNA polymerase sigma factor, partial [bacterium]